MTSGILSQESLRNLGNVLHLPLERKDGSITRDYSPPHGKDITTNGDVKQILPFPGAGVGVFDGTGDYLTIPDSDDWNIFDSNFTIEFLWCPNNVTSTSHRFCGQFVDSGNYWGVYWNSSTNNLYLEVDTASTYRANYYCTLSIIPVVGTYYHIVVERYGSSCLIFINGISQTVTISAAWNGTSNISGPLTIGSVLTVVTASCNLSEFRISNIARYTGPFALPRYQFTSDSNTKLLLHFTPTGTTFTDSSPSPKTVTANGDAKCITSPISGTGLAYFDGTTPYDYVSVPDSDDWHFTGDFTIESWVNDTTWGTLFCQRANASTDLCPILLWGGRSSWNVLLSFNNTSWVANPTINTGTLTGITGPYHIALVRYGSTFTLYINGLVKGTYVSSSTFTNKSNPIYIGSHPDGYGIIGYLGEYRISTIARYTGEFTPQATPFTPDPYTKLLLHFDNFTNPVKFTDSSRSSLPHHATITGDCLIRTGKDGRGVMYFDGSDRLLIPDVSDYDIGLLNTPFTISCWVLSTMTNTATPSMLFGRGGGSEAWNDTTGFQFLWYYRGTDFGTTQIAWKSGTGSANSYLDITGNVFNDGYWNFHTLKYDGSTLYAYKNNVLLTSKTSVVFAKPVPTHTTICSGPYASPSYYMQAYIKDFQIFKGTALSMDQLADIMRHTDPR